MKNKNGIFSSIWNWLKGLFVGRHRQVDNIQKEKLERPLTTVLKRFVSKKTSVIAVLGFVFMLIIVFIAPYFYKIDVTYTSATQQNKAPGFNYLSVPDELKSAKMISIGPSYGVGIDERGKVHVWGDGKINKVISLNDIPKEVQEDTFEWVAAGSNFIIAVAESGKLYGWGDNNLAQYGTKPPNSTLDTLRYCNEIYWNAPRGFKDFDKTIKSIQAGYQVVFVVFTDGSIYAWGNSGNWDTNRMDEMRHYDGGSKTSSGKILESYEEVIYETVGDEQVEVSRITTKLEVIKLAFVYNNALALNKDGTLLHFGSMEPGMNNLLDLDIQYTSTYKKGDTVPGTTSTYTTLYDFIGNRKVVDIAATWKEIVISLDDGTLINSGGSGGFSNFPKNYGKMVQLIGAENHVFGINENGELFAWGENKLGQLNIPDSIAKLNYFEESYRLFAGYNGNIAITKDDKVVAWGLKGYLLGTDAKGRDVFVRLMNGGKKTLTIGAVAVIISSILGIVIGILSGYFGGVLDLLLMRIAEVVSSLPFLPFALILSAVLGSAVSENQRMYIIMVVLGVLTWPSLSRLVRGQVLAEREKDFVLAAKAIGVRETGIAFRHILPNIISVILVTMTLDFAGCLLIESSLSYLGFGVKEPQPTWGNMLTGASNSNIIEEYWWQWVFPSLALGISTISINLIGDGMRDAIDPKSGER